MKASKNPIRGKWRENRRKKLTEKKEKENCQTRDQKWKPRKNDRNPSKFKISPRPASPNRSAKIQRQRKRTLQLRSLQWRRKTTAKCEFKTLLKIQFSKFEISFFFQMTFSDWKTGLFLFPFFFDFLNSNSSRNLLLQKPLKRSQFINRKFKINSQ